MKNESINWLGYSNDNIGMIHWSAYWDTYSLILSVNDRNITELDSFGRINDTDGHKIRTHCTRLSKKDRFYTIQEFFQLNNKEK